MLPQLLSSGPSRLQRLASRPNLRHAEPVPHEPVLECVVNISEGCDHRALEDLATATGASLLDVHRDCAHHRSVFTLGGNYEVVAGAARRLAARAVDLVDLSRHHGAHPRLGAVDVVPFVALRGRPLADEPAGDDRGAHPGARAVRDEFAQWAGGALELPVFLYGPERSLPELRRSAWSTARPDYGPGHPHPTAGAVAVGCRPLMLAYNLWLARPQVTEARALAAKLRSADVRALAFRLGGDVQLSFNLINPLVVGPKEVMDAVASELEVVRAELVGLVPSSVLQRVPRRRWAELGLTEERTIEARLEEAWGK